MDLNEIAVVKAFITAINQGDACQLSSLMTEDHTFVDSGGKVESGRDNLAEGWNKYFRMFPDFRIEVQNMLQDGNLVAVFGSASGTYNGKRGLVPENKIEMPAAWKARIESGKVKLWQVYADWTEGCKIIDEDSRSAARELGKHGITANAIAPGPIQTGYVTPKAVEEIAPDMPLRRVGEPKK